MPKRKSLDIKVNLLPEDPFFQTILGRTLRWAVSVGRYIVIFTELIVILSFGARFTLDRQLTDLNDQIHQKETVIQSYGDLESQVLSVQSRIDQYQQLAQSHNLADALPALSSITPTGVTLKELSLTPTSVTFSGTSQSQNALNLLISNISLSPSFFNVRINQISSTGSEADGITFQIAADTEKNAAGVVAAPVKFPTGTPAPGASTSP